VEEVKALFAEALATGAQPSEVFPDLFEGEPRFSSPQAAQRFYGNLFGLWDRLAAGHSEEPKAERPERPAPPPALPQPALLGRPPEDAFVEECFRYLASLQDRDRRRLRDRFEQRESDLIQAIASLKLEASAEDVGVDMGFELWVMAELALGPKVGRTDFGKLRQPPPAEINAALARYLEEWLEEATLDERDPLRAEDRARLQPMLQAAIAQLVG
jgi:hypothetical protein